MPTVVLTGCNSGIGHAWAKILIDEGYDVYALDVNKGDKLKALEGPNCKIFQLDVTSPDAIAEFKNTLGDKPVDILLNIAGIMPPPKTDALRTVNLKTMELAFSINAYGPMLLTQALLDNILAAPAPRTLAVISSRVGSLTDNSSGGYFAYRASKTAVNSFFKNLAVELKDHDVVVSMLHPGFTKTNLDPDIHKIPDAVEPEEAASKLWKVVQSKRSVEKDSGKFWHREGMELPW